MTVKEILSAEKCKRYAKILKDAIKADSGFFCAAGITVFMLWLENFIAWLSKSNTVVMNPFIHTLWVYLGAFGICMLAARFCGRTTGRILMTLLVVLNSIVCIAASVSMAFFQLRISGEVFFVLAASSTQEAKEFISIFFNYQFILLLLLLLVPIVFSLYLLWKKSWERTGISVVLAVIMILPLAINVLRKGIEGECWDVFKYTTGIRMINEYIHFNNDFRKIYNTIQNPQIPEGVACTLPDGVKKTVSVLVIGESASRHAMEVYGYPRETTPCMTKEKNSSIFFTDVLAAYPYTTKAVRTMLTNESYDNPDYNYTIFDIFKKAGWHTVFLSNQIKWGKNDSPVSMFTSRADQREFFQLGAFVNYDEIILGKFDQYVDQVEKPTLIVIHLFGSHAKYVNRYPESFTYFKDGKNQIEDQYANSIRYTDMVLGRIMEKLKSLPYPANMLYLSDHAVDFTQKKDRRSPASTNSIYYEVPFVLWGNASYRSQFSTFWHQAEKNKDLPFQLDHADWAIFAASQISFPAFQKDKDIFSSSYKIPAARYYGSLNHPEKKQQLPHKQD